MPAGVGCHGNRTISSIWEGGEGEENILHLVFYYWNMSAGLEEHAGSSVPACGPDGDSWKWGKVPGITLLSRISFGPM